MAFLAHGDIDNVPFLSRNGVRDLKTELYYDQTLDARRDVSYAAGPWFCSLCLLFRHRVSGQRFCLLDRLFLTRLF